MVFVYEDLCFSSQNSTYEISPQICVMFQFVTLTDRHRVYNSISVFEMDKPSYNGLPQP